MQRYHGRLDDVAFVSVSASVSVSVSADSCSLSFSLCIKIVQRCLKMYVDVAMVVYVVHCNTLH